MANKNQATQIKAESKNSKAPPEAKATASEVESMSLPFSLLAGFPIDRQAELMRSNHLHPMQRQQVARHIAQVKGNHTLQRMVNPDGKNSAIRPKMVQRQMVVQRALTEEQEAFYKDHKGDEIVAAIKADVVKWQTFRATPTSWGQRPDISSAAGSSAPLALATLYNESETAVKQHIVQKLDPGSFKYLSEMASFIEGYRSICGVVPGVTYKAADHKYEMTQKESWTDRLPFYPVNTLQVKYSNAFGWSWTKELTGSTLKIAVEIGVSAEREGGKVKGKPGGGFGLTLWPSRIGIDTKARASSSAGYWGYEDLAGIIVLTNGPSISAKVSVYGGKIGGSGGVIKLAGGGGSPPGGLDFTIEALNLDVGIIKRINPEPSDSPIKPGEGGKITHTFKDVEAKFTLVEEAGGYVAGGSVERSIPTPEPIAVPEKKTFKYAISGFETGEAEAPITAAECAGPMRQMEKDISNEVTNFGEIESFIIDAGVVPHYSIEVQIQGFASRAWKGARSDAERQQKNLELSTRRANDVKQILEGVIHNANATFTAEGKGSAMYLPIDGAANYNEESGRWEEGVKGGIVVPEGDTEAIDRWREKRRAQLRRDFLYSSLPPEQQVTTDKQIDDIIKEEEKNLNRKTSDVPGARMVGVVVNWNGYKIEWGTENRETGG